MASPAANGKSIASSGSLEWLLSRFVDDTGGVTSAITVSSDGFLLASSSRTPETSLEQLAAVISGLTSLTQGAADLYQLGEVHQVIVEMAEGLLFMVSVGDGAALAAVADAGCDLGTVGYELTLLAGRTAEILTPEVVDLLKNALSPTADTGTGP